VNFWDWLENQNVAVIWLVGCVAFVAGDQLCPCDIRRRARISMWLAFVAAFACDFCQSQPDEVETVLVFLFRAWGVGMFAYGAASMAGILVWQPWHNAMAALHGRRYRRELERRFADQLRIDEERRLLAAREAEAARAASRPQFSTVDELNDWRDRRRKIIKSAHLDELEREHALIALHQDYIRKLSQLIQ